MLKKKNDALPAERERLRKQGNMLSAVANWIEAMKEFADEEISDSEVDNSSDSDVLY